MAINVKTFDVTISGKSCDHCFATDGQCSIYEKNPKYCINEELEIATGKLDHCSISSSDSDRCEARDVGEF